MLYGPRWGYGIPLAFVLPGVLLWAPRWLWIVALSASFVLIPIMGFCVPWRTWGRSGDADFRVVSYNIQRYSVREEDFAVLLDEVQPDAIAVQECSGVGGYKRWNLPEPWHMHRASELMVGSRHPILRVEEFTCRWPPHRKHINAIYCVLDTPHGELGFCCLHLNTPRRGLSQVLNRGDIALDKTDEAEQWNEWRRRESAELAEWLSAFPEPKIIAGDFNMPVDSTIYQEYWSDYRNGFSRAGFGLGYTKQTTIRRRTYGLRIDHILGDRFWRPTRCWVGPDLGSDHLPVIGEWAGD